MSPLAPSASMMMNRSPTRGRSPGVLSHEWSGRLNASKEAKKQSEAQLHALLNRISLLEEAEERTARMLLKSRQKIFNAETLKSTIPAGALQGLGQAGGLSTLGDSSTLIRPLSQSFTSPIKPLSTHAHNFTNGGSFGARPPSPVRASGWALPTGGINASLERYGSVAAAARMLKETQAMAEREAQTAEAAAYRAEKDFRLALVRETKQHIYEANREMHGFVKTAADIAKEHKQQSMTEAEMRRRRDYELRIQAEEIARNVAESRMRQLEDIESRVLDRLKTSSSVKLDTLRMPYSPSHSISRQESLLPSAGGPNSASQLAQSIAGFSPPGSPGFLAGDRLPHPSTSYGNRSLSTGAGTMRGRAGLASTSGSIGFGSTFISAGGGAGDLATLGDSRPGTRTASQTGTRRRLAQTAGPSYAIF
jgi:hypothetical protein